MNRRHENTQNTEIIIYLSLNILNTMRYRKIRRFEWGKENRLNMILLNIASSEFQTLQQHSHRIPCKKIKTLWNVGLQQGHLQ